MTALAWGSGEEGDPPVVDRVYLPVGPVILPIEGHSGDRVLTNGGFSTGPRVRKDHLGSCSSPSSVVVPTAL